MEKLQILMIEDDAEISRLTSMYLAQEGFDTVIIDDGLAAIQAIRSYAPDLIILDLLLPNISGVEICKQARTFYTGPIVILSANDDDSVKFSLLNLGADVFLAKPLRPEFLVTSIHALLDL